MTYVSVKPQHAKGHFPRFAHWFDQYAENEFAHTEGRHTPTLVNVKETKDSYRIEVAAPGYSKDAFKIAVQDMTLSISADAVEAPTQEDDKWTRREYHYNGFKRSFSLPKTVDVEKIGAEYKEGILHVTLPKMEEAKSKGLIEVKIS